MIDYGTLVTPSILGDRVAGIAVYFSRFKFNWLKFELRSKMPTSTPGTAVSAVLDDATTAGTGSTTAQLLDFRTSMEKHIYSDQILRWSPMDKSKLYYTVGGNDERDRTPCSYFVATDDAISGTSISTYSLDIHYSITFEGANPNGYGLQEHDYISLPITPSGSAPPAARPNPTLRR